MRNIRFNTLLVFLMFISYSAIGQQEYQSKHYGGPGTIYLYNRYSGLIPQQEVTEAGANITWDLSLNTGLNTHPSQIVTPSEAIDQFTFLTICSLSGISAFECFSIWNKTDQTLLLKDSITLFGFSLADLQRYQDKSSNLLLENFFGFTVDFGGTVQTGVIVYQDPDTIFHFPIRYNDSWTSDIFWNLDLSATGQNIVYESHQTRTTHVDAWGTVVTPYDTFTNVVRLRSEIVHVDTLVTDSITLPVNLIQVEYMWFDTNYKLPIMIANGIVTDTVEVINVLEYIYEAVCPAPTWALENISGDYYIDASGGVTVDFNINNSNANTYTWSFNDGTIVTNGPAISHTFTSAGDYNVTVSGCMTDCLPLNSCTTQAVNILVIDTLSAVPVVPGDQLGIKLYPSPASKYFTVEIPGEFADLNYRIVDMTGRELGKGKLSSGTNSINSEYLENGVYSLHIWSDATSLKQQAVMRFSVKK